LPPLSGHEVNVLNTPGVLSIYKKDGEPLPIPHAEIACLQHILGSEYPVEPGGFPKTGDVIEIEGSDNIRGVLVERGVECRVAIGFNVMQNTVIIRVPLDSLRAINDDQLTPHWSLRFL